MSTKARMTVGDIESRVYKVLRNIEEARDQKRKAFLKHNNKNWWTRLWYGEELSAEQEFWAIRIGYYANLIASRLMLVCQATSVSYVDVDSKDLQEMEEWNT